MASEFGVSVLPAMGGSENDEGLWLGLGLRVRVW